MSHFLIFESPLWRDMFWLSLPVAEKILRALIVYLFLVTLLRIFGKRELAQLNPFDLVVLLSLSNTVQNAIIGDDNSVTGGLIGAMTLMGANYLLVRFIFKHRRLDQFLEGQPTTLIEGGVIRQGGLAKELLTESELLMVAHRQGFSNLNEIERCVLEPGGGFYMRGKRPLAAERQHAELLERLDRLDQQLSELRRRM
ncbi:MAG TPA: YetF domain-containing protein [Blastocatellia bacterium]|nr:YetF domain-containing protein [Blastocatellia bacterium]